MAPPIFILSLRALMPMQLLAVTLSLFSYSRFNATKHEVYMENNTFTCASIMHGKRYKNSISTVKVVGLLLDYNGNDFQISS